MITFIVALMTTAAWAVPANNVLIQPQSVKLLDNGTIAVTFRSPCTHSIDWTGFVLTNDDSGDCEVAVGVVVPMSHCRLVGETLQTEIVNPARYGYERHVDTSYVPMQVGGAAPARAALPHAVR
jgi:hypothetical protein